MAKKSIEPNKTKPMALMPSLPLEVVDLLQAEEALGSNIKEIDKKVIILGVVMMKAEAEEVEEGGVEDLILLEVLEEVEAAKEI